MNKPIILFDGICELCDSFCLFIMDHSSVDFEFIPLQSEDANNLLLPFAYENKLDTVIFIENGKLYSHSNAVIEISKYLHKPWCYFKWFRFIPTFIRDYLYSIVAKHRYKWFGQKSECRMPKRK